MLNAETDRESVNAQSEIKSLKANEVLKDKVIEEVWEYNGINHIDTITHYVLVQCFYQSRTLIILQLMKMLDT